MEADNSFLYYYKKASPAVLQNNFEQQLFYKSLTLSETKNLLSALEQNKDTLLQAVFKAWKVQKKELAKQYALPLNNRSPEIKQMETNAENLEKELGRRSAAFSKQKKELAVSMADVQQHLQKDEVAIEFVRFQLINTKGTDSIIYAAYLLNSYDAVPKFIPLCEEKQLGKYFSLTGGAANIKNIYRSEVTDETQTASLSGDSLYFLIWKPLMPYLKQIKKVNYAPAGLLFKVAFHALPAGDSLLLMDRFELNQYGSVRQLALVNEKKTQNNGIALFGNCTYSMDSTDQIKNITDAEKVNTLITASGDRSDYAGGWKELEGTASEIEAIQVLCTQNKTTTRLYSKAKATEEQFKLLSGNSPTVIHLATHGFFLPDPAQKREAGFNVDSRNAFTLADDPLLRSGIVLSGANRVWAGKPPVAGCEDGIITAYEIAQMDLNQTNLVVLSACETALGDIKGSEGVFGLQRAFKLAGVKNMLLSLWKVPDAETAELMKIFYGHYLQGKTTREAFSAAQQVMRKQYKPYYWAAFVLIE